MTPWVRRLLFANVLVFLLQQISPEINYYLELVPGLLLFRPWTAFTYMFLHASFGHIFFNMLGLFFFGPGVESRLGGRHFIRLYLASGVMGALLSLVTPGAAIVGASGAIFGVELAFARFWPRAKILIYGILPVEAWALVILMTLFSLFSGFGFFGDASVAHFAHLGGFLGGYLYLKWMEFRSPTRQFRASTAAPAAPADGTSGLKRWSRIKRENLHEVNRDELDRILSKIDRGGVGSLTPGDREFLDRFSRE